MSVNQGRTSEPSRELQPIPVAEWKWEHVTMNFVSGSLQSRRDNDTIWIVVDRLTKSAHFLPMRITDSKEKLSQFYITEIVRLHRDPLSGVFDWDPQFTSSSGTVFKQVSGQSYYLVQRTIPRRKVS